MSRELGPQGIHVAHIVIDGAIDTAFIKDMFPERYALKDQGGVLDPDAIAENYWKSTVNRAPPGLTKSTCGRGWKNGDADQRPIALSNS
jgi:hypothetical protein